MRGWAWRSTLAGGLLLAAAGAIALSIFAGAPAREMFALPALVLSALFLALACLRKGDR